MVYNSRTMNNHTYLCYMQIHCDYISALHSNGRLLRTIYKISVMCEEVISNS